MVTGTRWVRMPRFCRISPFGQWQPARQPNTLENSFPSTPAGARDPLKAPLWDDSFLSTPSRLLCDWGAGGVTTKVVLPREVECDNWFRPGTLPERGCPSALWAGGDLAVRRRFVDSGLGTEVLSGPSSRPFRRGISKERHRPAGVRTAESAVDGLPT